MGLGVSMALRDGIKTITAGLGVYGSWQMLVLGMMGFAAGLPLVMLGTPLQAWLTEAGLSTVTIGRFSLIGLPYSFKFFWSPVMDRFILPAPGRLQGSRRRSWMVVLQLLLVIAIAWLGHQDPRQSQVLMGVALLVAFLSASQDIVIDAYRTDSLSEAEMGAGAAVYVFGYRIAVLAAGSAALFLADQGLSWPQVYLLMGLLLIPQALITYWAPETETTDLPPESMMAAVVEPFQAFWRRFQVRSVPINFAPVGVILARPQALLTLLLVGIYQLADRISSPLTTTFLLDLGFSKTDLSLRIWIIFGATIAGVLVGGWAVNRIGIRGSLLGFALLQGASNLSFMVLALVGNHYPTMLAATVVENFCGGTSTAAFLAYLMSLCDRKYTATQYALLSSLFVFGGTLMGSVSGYVAQLGWPAFWGLTSLGALPGIMLLLILPISTARGPEVDDGAPTAEQVLSGQGMDP